MSFSVRAYASAPAEVAIGEMEVNSYGELVGLLAELGVENPEAVLDDEGSVSILRHAKM
jgi:hypothetical protein